MVGRERPSRRRRAGCRRKPGRAPDRSTTWLAGAACAPMRRHRRVIGQVADPDVREPDSDRIGRPGLCLQQQGEAGAVESCRCVGQPAPHRAAAGRRAARQVGDLVLGAGLAEQRRIGALGVEAEALTVSGRAATSGDRVSRTASARHRKMPMFGMLYRPREAQRRGDPADSPVWARSSNAPGLDLLSQLSASIERRSGVARACGRTWFMYCVVTSRSKNSTARAGQPVTSRASCSSIDAVPLRRR